MSDLHSYLVIVIILLCISLLLNFMMSYKYYLSNQSNDPFIPENIGQYNISIYYNKYKNPMEGIDQKIKPLIDPFKNSTIGQYVITYKRPTQLEYKQIAQLGSSSF
jgi:hypothetical protein